jgi:hypothetical protein
VRITTRIVFDIDGNILEHEWHEYYGPVALCDRAASNASKTNAATAGNVASQEGSSANAIGSQLTPFYRQEMNATHAFDPSQTNELLNYAEGPAAGSAATTAGKAASEAARTRNTSGFSSALDQAARNRNQAVGTASEGIGAEDIMGAKQLNQEGAAGMSNLYDVDTNAMLKAMGQQNTDIGTEVEAGKSGWFENAMNAITTLTGGAKNAASAYNSYENA